MPNVFVLIFITREKMSAPRKVRKEQLVKIQPTQRLAISVEPNLTQQEVMNAVKLEGGTKQTATQVKGLSSEITDIIEADAVHLAEGSKWDSANGELFSLYRSRRPWYALRWILRELGRSLFLPQGYDRTSHKKQGLSNGNREVGWINSTPSMGKPCTWGSDPQGRARFGIIYFNEHTEASL